MRESIIGLTHSRARSHRRRLDWKQARPRTQKDRVATHAPNGCVAYDIWRVL
jgi:hypothetical protein